MNDARNGGYEARSPHYIEVRQTTGVGAGNKAFIGAYPYAAPNGTLLANNGVPDYYVFRVEHADVGCTFTVDLRGGAESDDTRMVGIAFEAIAPPAWVPGWPAVDSPTIDGFTVRMKTDADGTGYYVVLADGAAAPGVAQVKAGQDSSGAPALRSGNLPLAANSENTEAVIGLSANTAYDVYFVATGTANSDQASVVKKDFRTPSPVLSSSSVESGREGQRPVRAGDGCHGLAQAGA